MLEDIKHWMRMTDAKYEEHMDRLRDARMDKWRGRAYYECVNCHEAGNVRNFHIAPVFIASKTYPGKLELSLQPMCHSCWLYFTADDKEEEIVE